MNSKNNKALIILCAIMLIGVGYAFLTADLGITGTTNVSDNRWSVHFVKDSIVGKHLATVEGKVPTIKNDSNNLSVEFTADLDKPGDIYEFSVDITNDGTIDAMLGDYSKTPEELPVYLIYTATWNNGYEPEKYDALNVGDTLTLKVKVAYSTEITADQIETEEVEPLTMSIVLPYVQADDKAETVDLKFTPNRFAFTELGTMYTPTETFETVSDYTMLRYDSEANGEYANAQARVFLGLDKNGNKGVCTLKTGTLECLKSNNYEEEVEHLKEMFDAENECSLIENETCSQPDGSEVPCSVFECFDSSFDCLVDSVGYVVCGDFDAYRGCGVLSVGSVECYEW